MLGFSCSAWSREQKRVIILLTALLGTVEQVCQESTSQALEILRTSRGAEFCFVWLQQDTWITPFCLQHSSAPLGTVPAGTGHCDTSHLSYSPSLSFWVCCHKQTHTIHLSPMNAPIKSLAADSDYSLFLSPRVTHSQIQVQPMTSRLVAGGNETSETWL